MGCFCNQIPLTALLPQLNLSGTISIPGANIPLSLSAWLSARGLPALPWQPEPHWLDLALPDVRLDLRTVATISALAQLRAQVRAQFGLDLLIPRHVLAFARIVATMNVRVSALANLSINPLAWAQLAMLNAAIDQIAVALRTGLLMPSPELTLSLTSPGGIPLQRWSGFLASLRTLLPLITAAAQLNIGLSETAQLSAALRVLMRISLPLLAAPQFIASMTVALNAVLGLRASLGIDPLQMGFPAVHSQVSLKLQLLLAQISTLPSLPDLMTVPTSFASNATLESALQASAFASVDLQVPLGLPAIGVGLTTCAFAHSLSAVLGRQAVPSAPCVVGCDAAHVMRSLAMDIAA
jgi:hypothetical protein